MKCTECDSYGTEICKNYECGKTISIEEHKKLLSKAWDKGYALGLVESLTKIKNAIERSEQETGVDDE